MVLGIDIGKKRFHVALKVEGKFKEKAFDNTSQGHQQLLEWLERWAKDPIHACLEATGSYGEAVAECLHDKGHRVSLINPMRIKSFGQSLGLRSKTDRVDAKLIALFCEAMQPPLWQPLPLEQRQLKALVRRLDAVLGMRTQELNRLEEATDPLVQQDLKAHIQYLDNTIAELRQRIQDHIDQNPGLKQQQDLLNSIPGIGNTTSAWLLSEINFNSYAHARQLAAHAGLVPRHWQSGLLRPKSALSKIGNPYLRKALYLPALTAIRHNVVIQIFARRLADKGKAKMSIVAAVMRKLLHIAFGVIKSGKPFNPDYA
jgi:transposase